jgi:hypothetical protein
MDFIERIFGISPDDGSGATELLILGVAVTNAWKFTSKQHNARIEVGVRNDDPRTLFVRDNGAGFDISYASKLFGVSTTSLCNGLPGNWYRTCHGTADHPPARRPGLGTGAGSRTGRMTGPYHERKKRFQGNAFPRMRQHELATRVRFGARLSVDRAPAGGDHRRALSRSTTGSA